MGELGGCDGHDTMPTVKVYYPSPYRQSEFLELTTASCSPQIGDFGVMTGMQNMKRWKKHKQVRHHTHTACILTSVLVQDTLYGRCERPVKIRTLLR